MAEKSDLDIRHDGSWGIFYILIGLCVGGFAIFMATRLARGFVGQNDGVAAVMVVPGLIGLGLILYGGVSLFDRGIKLSLTGEGLKDHRTNTLVKWTDFRGVRLFVKTTNGWLSSATMYVKVPNGEAERE